MPDTNSLPDYRSTVFLPATPFPMRGDLPKREPELLARWDRIGLWDRTVAAMTGRPQFVLHDGPIYSNGHLHIGHALNRILKDVVMRAHRMAGQDVGYIPGWDTHGLPAELEAMRQLGLKTKDDILDMGIEKFNDAAKKSVMKYASDWEDYVTRMGRWVDFERGYATSVPQLKENIARLVAISAAGLNIEDTQGDRTLFPIGEAADRVAAVREHLGDTPLMVDANQQWDRAQARRMCRELEAFDLVWIEEPLDAWDAVGHADLSRTFDTPIATGEMLTSVPEHMALIDAGYRGIVQPDAPRIGGITPFLRFATLASHAGLALAPHYAMEIHLHLAAAYPTEPWVEHFEWLNPLFDERIDIHDGRMWVPERPGLGFTLSERMRELTVETAEFGSR